MFGCSQKVHNRISIGPGTNIAVCEGHYIDFKKELSPESKGIIIKKAPND